MFRLGLFLYVPVYFLVPELRGLIIVDGENTWVILGMVVLTAIRYLANACSYTAVMVLINLLTPPEYVPLANGLAQSAVSFARFLGESQFDNFSMVSSLTRSLPNRSSSRWLRLCRLDLGQVEPSTSTRILSHRNPLFCRFPHEFPNSMTLCSTFLSVVVVVQP